MFRLSFLMTLPSYSLPFQPRHPHLNQPIYPPSPPPATSISSIPPTAQQLSTQKLRLQVGEPRSCHSSWCGYSSRAITNRSTRPTQAKALHHTSAKAYTPRRTTNLASREKGQNWHVPSRPTVDIHLLTPAAVSGCGLRVQ